MEIQIPEQNKKRVAQALFTFLIILSAYFAVKIFSEIKKDNMLGESTTPATISFTGHGEITATPDIASVYFTISKDASNAKDAQDGVALIEKKALDFLKSKGVADKDIQATDASFYPKYEYRQEVCVQMYPNYCPPGKQVLSGYTASESVTVKIRKIDDASAIIQGLGDTGISNLNGPNFQIDNEDGLKAQARKQAIEDAKQKALALANDLGVSLGKISSFNESGNYPIMYAAEASMAKDSGGVAPAPAQLPKGETKITSDVTITYEIR